MNPVPVVPRTTLLSLYRAGTAIAQPFAGMLLRRRAGRGKEDLSRLNERFGEPKLARPSGPLVWAHAASVGESVSLLPLIRAILEERTDVHALVTTGTVTSAQMMEARLPARAFHQYAPVDLIPSVRGFLDHWRPDLAIWVESELWPNLILETAARATPMALISARMSETSQKNWTRAPQTAKGLLSSFSLIMPQDASSAERLAQLGAERLGEISNLKLWADPLPHDPRALAALRDSIGTRPVWLAASTHEGEEALAGHIHARLARACPGLLTVIAPRHPRRGAAICQVLRDQGLRVAQRAKSEPITPDTDIYLADTLGEMGLLYQVAPVVLIGKTLVSRGGQNPLEPARHGCAILSGPYVANFEPVFDMLTRAKAADVLPDAAAIERRLGVLLAHLEEARAMGQRALRVAADPLPLQRTLDGLRPLLKAMPHDARA
jgi:3-deoxy-D-manno-octulosonic-acid transferase